MLNDQPKRDVQIRNHQRLAVAFALTYRIDGNPVVRAGRALDIGGGGIAFESDETLPEGEHIEIGFELLRGSRIDVRGKVTASHFDRANGVHQNRVAFEGLSDGVRDSIRAFVFEALRTAIVNFTPEERPKSDVHLREYQRLEVNFRFTYSTEGDSAVRFGHARDISAGGIHFDSQEALAEGAHVEMQFELRPDLRIELSGKLASSRFDPASETYQHRIAFENIGADVRQAIRAFVNEALRSSLMK